MSSNLIEFNCLGTIFVIKEKSLNRFPNTLLGNPKYRATLFNETKEQYIIDRHLVSFEAIINYYETGKLIAPNIYEPIIFYNELKYFQIDSKIIEYFYQTRIHNELTIFYRIIPKNRFLRYIWIALEYNDYSFLTQIIHLICLIVCLLFCFTISIELIPQLSREKLICYKLLINDKSNHCENIFFDFRPSKTIGENIYKLERICTIFITIESILRLFSSPHKWSTLVSLFNIFDLIILCSNWLYIILIDINISKDDEYDPFFFLRSFQYIMILRLFRFIRLCRYIKTLRVFFRGTQTAFTDIVSIGFILLFFVFTFGVIIQILEKNREHAYITRLEDLFNIITISTITVGDAKRVPISAFGKIFCAFLAGIGVVGISLPLPTIYQIFHLNYRKENIDKRFLTIKYIYSDGKPAKI